MTSSKFQIGDRVWKEAFIGIFHGTIVQKLGNNFIRIRWDDSVRTFIYDKDELTLYETAIDKLDDIL